MFDIKTKKPTDQVKVQVERDTLTFHVASQSGIGGATVGVWRKGHGRRRSLFVCTSAAWNRLPFRTARSSSWAPSSSQNGHTQHLCLAEEGRDEKREPGTEIKVLDATGKAIAGLPGKGGCFEIMLPPALLEGQPKSLELGWIDFYRG